MEKHRIPISKPAVPPPPSVEIPTGPTRPESISRPRVVDFFFLFVGVILSALLTNMAGLHLMPRGAIVDVGKAETLLLPVLPLGLFLPIGIVLFWPLFFLTQRICGRHSGMCSAEWLLGIGWLTFSALSVWIVARYTEILPTSLNTEAVRGYVILGYILFMISMAGISLLLFVIDLISGWQQPWTQAFTIMLMIWPMIPLACIWFMGLKFEIGGGLLNVPQIQNL